MPAGSVLAPAGGGILFASSVEERAGAAGKAKEEYAQDDDAHYLQCYKKTMEKPTRSILRDDGYPLSPLPAAAPSR